MFHRILGLSLLLGGLAAAEPRLDWKARIIREYQQNGETRTQEFNPSFSISENEFRVGDQAVQAPVIADPDAQKMFNNFLQMFARQALPEFSRLNTSHGQPLELRLEIPNLGEKLIIQLQPSDAAP